MSNYAKIENGVVTNLIVCEDDIISEFDGLFVKITENTNDAQNGYEYIAAENKFKAPKPYNSWTLNEETFLWEAPTAKPAGEGFYRWDEAEQNWILVS